MTQNATPAGLAERKTELTEIARAVLVISGVGITIVAVVTLLGGALSKSTDFAKTSEMVFNALLPLMGTWVGTVLAYYFSRKNYESASNSVERMVALTTDQKLRQMDVADKMLALSRITVHRIPAGKSDADVPLSDLQDKLQGDITRLPILGPNDDLRYIVHLTALYRLVAQRAIGGAAKADIDKLTLQDLATDKDLHDWITNFAFVAEHATVADAKARMEARTKCQDVAVTRTGQPDEPMLGWLTNVEIGKLSKA